MKGEILFLMLLMYLPAGVKCSCYVADWSSSFDSKGLSYCRQGNTYLRGLDRNKRLARDQDGIRYLERAQCCTPPETWHGSQTQTFYTEWDKTLDDNNNWATCPDGYFLQGFIRSDSFPGFLSNIESGRCTKPSNHPNYFGHCYFEDISNCFDKEGLCKCKDDYFITGIYRGDCNDLHCMETLKCCRMFEKKDNLNELSKVKLAVMDSTMSNIAYLANYLGYGWCAGCRAEFVGEDFIRDGDTWRSHLIKDCDGYRYWQRLAMKYDDWGFTIADMKYGDPIVTEMEPVETASGTIYNEDPTDVEKSIQRSETTVRSVNHITTSSWKHGGELGLTFNFNPLDLFGFSRTFKFNYERSSSTTDETGSQQTKTLTVNTKKTLKPYTAAKWKTILINKRTTVPYVATIRVKFSVELQGFLRWGGGRNNPNTNYHYLHEGSGERPTFNYKFGNKDTPFYTALKDEAGLEYSSIPWLWNKLKINHPGVNDLVEFLTKENQYEFKLTGEFADVVGRRLDIVWGGSTLNRTETFKSSPKARKSSRKGRRPRETSDNPLRAQQNPEVFLLAEEPTFNVTQLAAAGD